MSGEAYLHVPAEAAQEVAWLYEKDLVLILSLDRAHVRTGFASYGKAAIDKIVAARASEAIQKALGFGSDGKGEWEQDFRRDLSPEVLNAAERKELLDLRERLGKLTEMLAEERDRVEVCRESRDKAREEAKEAVRSEMAELRKKVGLLAQPLEDWHEDLPHGTDCLWWKFPINEPPYMGSPLDTEFPDDVTHFTPIVCPEQPAAEVPT